jgi:hypothetical protein
MGFTPPMTFSGNSEITRLAVNLHETVLFAVARDVRARGEHKQVKSAPAGTDFGVGVEFSHNLCGSGA